jgi:hypothetical protein
MLAHLSLVSQHDNHRGKLSFGIPEFHPLYSFVSPLIVSAPLHQYREAVKAKWLAKKSGQKYPHRFDLGKLKNIQMVYTSTSQHLNFSFRSSTLVVTSRGTRKVCRHTSSQLIGETSGWTRAWTSSARRWPRRRGRILQGRGQGNSLHHQYYGVPPLFIVSQDRHPPHTQKKTLTE